MMRGVGRADERGGRSSGRARRSNNNCLSGTRWSGRSIDKKHTTARLAARPHPDAAPTIIRLVHYRFITFAVMTADVDTASGHSGRAGRRTTRHVGPQTLLVTTQQTIQQSTEWPPQTRRTLNVRTRYSHT